MSGPITMASFYRLTPQIPTSQSEYVLPCKNTKMFLQDENEKQPIT